jgi:hypothetical protein
MLVSLAMWGFIVNRGKTFLPRPPHVDTRVQAGAVGFLAADTQLRFSRGPFRPRFAAIA